VLTEALRDFQGTVIVISHDKAFLEAFQPTHVMTVREGKVALEERQLREDDWNDILGSREASKFASNQEITSKGTLNVSDSKTAIKQKPQKKKGGAKQITKIESSITKYEGEIAVVDEEMITHGRNRAKLNELSQKRSDLQSKLDELYASYEDLMA